MDWQDRLRDLSEQVAVGKISAAEYRQRSDEILAESGAEGAEPASGTAPRRTHIPTSAAWESPSGEMTQLVGINDATTIVPADDPTQKINVDEVTRTESMRPPT